MITLVQQVVLWTYIFFFIIEVVTTAAKTWSEKCGLFWEDSPIPDVCYHFDNRLSSWMEARTKCQMLSGKLVSITSTHEQLYLAGKFYL